MAKNAIYPNVLPTQGPISHGSRLVRLVRSFLCTNSKGGPQPLMIGVGGAFNVLAGVVPEAPIWMQNLSLEWLYRLIQEPKRLFKRYLVTNTKFLFYQFTGAKRKEGK